MISDLMMRKQNRAEMKCMIAQWWSYHWLSVFFWNVLTKSLAESSFFAGGMWSVCILPLTCTMTPLLQHEFSPCTWKCCDFSHLRKIKPLLIPLPSLDIVIFCFLLQQRTSKHWVLGYPLPPVLVPSRADPNQGLLHRNKTATSLITFNFYIDRFKGQFLLSVGCPPFWNTFSNWLPKHYPLLPVLLPQWLFPPDLLS